MKTKKKKKKHLAHSFGFETENNDVIQVSKQEYESCTACNPIKVLNIGPAILPLTEKGVYYFISNFSNYCALGLKISVKVHDCPKRSQPTPSPSPSPLLAPPSSSPAPSPRRRGGSNPPVPSPNGYPPEAGAPAEKSIASTPSRFSVGSSKTFFGWGFQLCLVVFAILG
ncbi:early nodulin-20-like [Alnus glutinosa]|uniref:early nodulin-20-like n=1 Tax=Alnus glutinosa TaxID=3517 RepID=UPI002D794FC7|nr:early nodulin-20-like [Alnus glutinosa]